MSLGLLFIVKALFIRNDSRVHACLYYIYSTYTERTILSLEKNLHSSAEQKMHFFLHLSQLQKNIHWQFDKWNINSIYSLLYMRISRRNAKMLRVYCRGVRRHEIVVGHIIKPLLKKWWGTMSWNHQKVVGHVPPRLHLWWHPFTVKSGMIVLVGINLFIGENI